VRIGDSMGRMNVRGHRWTTQSRTLNQLVEGSSPSRLTGNVRAIKNQSRANRRGSFVHDEMAAESVQKYVER
jgi:hypothetical protein